MDAVIGSLVGVAVGFGLGWFRDWWGSRPRIELRIAQVRSVYAFFVAMMMKYAWMQCDETSDQRWTALLVVVNAAVLNGSSDDAVAEARLVVRGARSGERSARIPDFAAQDKGGRLYIPAMTAQERAFSGQNLPEHSLTEVRLVFEIYRDDLDPAAWSGLLVSKPEVHITTIRGATSKVEVDLTRVEALKQPWPKDQPTSPTYQTPPIRGYERFQERYEVFGSSYEDTYFGKRFIYPEDQLW
jgi:hypothetical protein